MLIRLICRYRIATNPGGNFVEVSINYVSKSTSSALWLIAFFCCCIYTVKHSEFATQYSTLTAFKNKSSANKSC